MIGQAIQTISGILASFVGLDIERTLAKEVVLETVEFERHVLEFYNRVQKDPLKEPLHVLRLGWAVKGMTRRYRRQGNRVWWRQTKKYWFDQGVVEASYSRSKVRKNSVRLVKKRFYEIITEETNRRRALQNELFIVVHQMDELYVGNVGTSLLWIIPTNPTRRAHAV